MTVRELRTMLYEMKNQDAEVGLVILAKLMQEWEHGGQAGRQNVINYKAEEAR